VCECEYACVYLYVCGYCGFFSLQCVSLPPYSRRCLYLSMSLSLSLCLSLSLSLSWSLCVSLPPYSRRCLSLSMSLSLLLCLSLSLSLSWSLSLHLCLSLCLYVCVCVYVYMCVQEVWQREWVCRKVGGWVSCTWIVCVYLRACGCCGCVLGSEMKKGGKYSRESITGLF